MAAVAEQPLVLPYYARPEENHDYVWRGVEYPRVTHVLGTIAKPNLYMWHAKMAAQECSDLLEKFDKGILTEQDAFDQIGDWQTRMTAPIRYRDHKGRIGSIVHHYLYELAMGDSTGDRRAWTMNTIEALHLLKHEESYENDYALTLAIQAEFYMDHVEDWLRTFKPEWDAIGQEAVVVNETYGYAGTCDGIAVFRQKDWPKNMTWNFEQDVVRLLVDFKTSKYLQDTFWWQVEAYRHGEFIGLVEDGSQHHVLTDTGIPMTDGSMILHIKPDTAIDTITSKPNEHLWEAFVSLIHVYNTLGEKASTQKVKKIVQAKAKPKQEGPRECPF